LLLFGLQEVLEEIEEERQKFNVTGVTAELSQNAWGEGGGPVLVACKDERMCMQLQDIISHGPQEVATPCMSFFFSEFYVSTWTFWFCFLSPFIICNSSRQKDLNLH
jgi:hypothetical protein